MFYRKFLCLSSCICRWPLLVAQCAECCKYVRNMLANCQSIFNASKSKCFVCQSTQRLKTVGTNSSIQFGINSSPIEVVNSWPHLGHVVSYDINDKSDIQRCHSKLTAQINSVYIWAC